MPQAIIFLIAGNFYFYPILLLLSIYKNRIFLLGLFFLGLFQSYLFNLPIKKYKFLINKNIKLVGSVKEVNSRSFILYASKIFYKNKTYKLNKNIFISYKKFNQLNLENGDKIEIKTKLRIPSNYPIPGTFNFVNYLKGKQVIFSAYLINKPQIINKRKTILIKYKNYIKNLINSQNIFEKIKFFEKGIILGEKNKLPNFIKSFLRKNGISHLFVISGLHVSIVFIFFVFIFRIIFYRLNNYYLPFFISLPLTYFYVLITGAGYPSLRAFLIICVVVLSLLVKRKRDGIRILLAIFLILIIFKPFSYLNISVQYSFVIVFFLIYLFKNLKNMNYFNKILISTFLCFLVGIPLTCYYFNGIFLKGLLVNLIAVPYFSLFIIPFSVIFLLFPLKFFLSLIGLEFIFFVKLIKFIPDTPMIFFTKPLFLEIILWYLILLIGISFFNKKFIKQKIFFIMLLSIISIIIHYKFHTFKNSIAVINLRKTKAMIINYKNQNILINGGNKNIILSYLLYNDIRSLDYFILTDYKKILLPSSEFLLSKFKIKNFYYPDKFEGKIPNFLKIKNNTIFFNNKKIKIRKKFYKISIKHIH